MSTGKLIVIEGTEGSGKTTLANGLLKHMEGEDVVFCREPGGTPLAERLRDLVKHGGDDEPVVPITELLCFFAARVQLYHRVIVPALARGATVISDRNYISSVMYQGFGNGQLESVVGLLDLTMSDLPKPDIYFYMDISYDDSMARVDNRGSRDSIEGRGKEYFETIIENYREWANNSENVIVLNATDTPETILSNAIAALDF